MSAGDPLLDGVSPVPDSYFTASSEYDINHKAYFARLSDGGPGWLASDAEVNANPPTFYLQVCHVITSYLMNLAIEAGTIITAICCVNLYVLMATDIVECSQAM